MEGSENMKDIARCVQVDGDDWFLPFLVLAGQPRSGWLHVVVGGTYVCWKKSLSVCTYVCLYVYVSLGEYWKEFLKENIKSLLE